LKNTNSTGNAESAKSEELTVFERASQLKRRKELYEKLYPETRAGISQAIGMHTELGHNVSAESAVTSNQPNHKETERTQSFVENTAEKTGLSKSTIERDIQIATNIDADVAEEIRSTKLETKKTDLLNIAKLFIWEFF